LAAEVAKQEVGLLGAAGNLAIQVGQDIDGEEDHDSSGWSVAISANGKRIAIGAIWNDSEDAERSGHVRVYDFDSWLDVDSRNRLICLAIRLPRRQTVNGLRLVPYSICPSAGRICKVNPRDEFTDIGRSQRTL
jgi:hypothetical protein